MNEPPTKDKRSLWRRLATSPLRDLVRGRNTGVVDARYAIDRTDLPGALKAAILQIVARVRWRPASRQRLAEQMIAGCHERLEVGATVEAVLGSLPESRSAVKRMWREGTMAREPLPEPLRALVNETVRKTRLYRSEKVDVARELYDHFSDGLRVGKTAKQMAESFGDVSQAARLIRRAKIRRRSWYHRLLVFFVHAAVATAATAFVGWCFITLRYFSAVPKISRNYLVEMDNEFAKIPPDDGARPLYRQAIMELPSTAFSGHGIWNDADELSDEARRLVSEHQNAVRLVRQATERSRFGFSFRDPSNRKWLLSHEHFTPEGVAKFQNTDEPVVFVLLPHIGSLHKLVDDARPLHAETGCRRDGHRAV